MKILLIMLFITSCSTVIPKSSKKSFRNTWNNDIVWNQKIYEASAFTLTYQQVDEMFIDSKDTQKAIKSANEDAKTASIILATGLGSALTYLFVAKKPDRGLYWSIYLSGLIPAIYYQTKRDETIDTAIKKYNKEKGFTLQPIISPDKKLGGRFVYALTF